MAAAASRKRLAAGAVPARNVRQNRVIKGCKGVARRGSAWEDAGRLPGDGYRHAVDIGLNCYVEAGGYTARGRHVPADDVDLGRCEN